MEPIVSIIIPTYRREEMLRQTLGAMLEQRQPMAELIVVDQTPVHEPETALALSDAGDRITYIRLAYPNLPAARNAGVRAARGGIVLFLDDDVWPGPELASRHLSHYCDPQVGAVAGRVHVAPLPDPEGYPWPNGPDIFDRNLPGERNFVRGCNMSFRRDAILKAGLFDERYSGNGVGEEEDMSFGVRRLGQRIVFGPEAWVIHLVASKGGCREGVGDIRETATFYRNKVYFALKNLAGSDFCRVFWDTYRSGVLDRPLRLRRHVSFWRGVRQGWQAYHQAGWRLKRLRYVGAGGE